MHGADRWRRQDLAPPAGQGADREQDVHEDSASPRHEHGPLAEPVASGRASRPAWEGHPRGHDAAPPARPLRVVAL
eukprot:7689327-Alexandrium_andersonii.AAC.1